MAYAGFKGGQDEAMPLLDRAALLNIDGLLLSFSVPPGKPEVDLDALCLVLTIVGGQQPCREHLWR